MLGVTSLVVAVPALVLARQSPRPHHGKLFVFLCLGLMLGGLVALAGAGNYRTEMTEAVEDHDVFDGQACTAGCLLSLLGGVVALACGSLHARPLHLKSVPPRKLHRQVRASESMTIRGEASRGGVFFLTASGFFTPIFRKTRARRVGHFLL